MLNRTKVNCGDILTLCNGYNEYEIDEIQCTDKFYYKLIVSNFVCKEMINFDQEIYSQGQELWISESDLHLFKLA